MNRTLYSPLTKIEKNDDGTLTFEGIASAETVDAVGETVLASAMKEALPDFFRYGTGALREMHGSNAAGTVDSAEVNEEGKTQITGTIVDPVSVQKCVKGVWKGLSIGGKVLARDPKNQKIITKLKLYEVSLVDRPCCPEAVLTMWKADGLMAPPEPESVPASLEQVRKALDDLSPADRVLVVAKAALALPVSIGDLLRRTGTYRPAGL